MGLTIDRTKNGLSLNQLNHLEQKVKQFGMENCKPTWTPQTPGQLHEKRKGEAEKYDGIPYLEAVGSLLHIMRFTRPDIAHATGVASRFNSCFTNEHWNAVKRIIAYLWTTKNYHLTYRKGEKDLEVFVDANFGGDVLDRKSTTGYLIKMNGGAVSWISKKQPTTALSTAEAEYVAAAVVAQEILWIKSFMKEIGQPIEQPIKIMEDNQACIAITENPIHHHKTTHVDLKYYFLKELVQEDVIKFQYCPSEEMEADGLTKALDRGKFEKFRNYLGIIEGGVLECSKSTRSFLNVPQEPNGITQNQEELSGSIN